MPWLARYLDARTNCSHFIRTKTGEWGLSSKVRAHRFTTRRKAEWAITRYINTRIQFGLMTMQSARKRFSVIPEVDSPRASGPTRTLWERILDDE